MIKRSRAVSVDLSTEVGSVHLANPIMTASGTVGHGAELSPYFDFSALGAIVTKSLLHEPWEGNPAPRVATVRSGMMNSVGLPGPGIRAWLDEDLPEIIAAGATKVVASIWGRELDDFATAADMLSDLPPEVIAVEVNISCPNTKHHGRMFAADPADAAAAIRATEAISVPRWAKLSPNVTDIVEIASSAADAGADALTLVNTVSGVAIDIESRTYAVGAKRGGISGSAIHPVAVRCVHDVRAALPDIPIVAAGGVLDAGDAIEFLMAGANAVQVGTATFADPRAPVRILEGISTWCGSHNVEAVRDLVGIIHEQ